MVMAMPVIKAVKSEFRAYRLGGTIFFPVF